MCKILSGLKHKILRYLYAIKIYSKAFFSDHKYTLYIGKNTNLRHCSHKKTCIFCMIFPIKLLFCSKTAFLCPFCCQILMQLQETFI